MFPYIATRNGRPYVNVSNTGGATAYKVSIKIEWPVPPEPVKGTRESVESPEFGKLSSGETISFESPHEFAVKEHFKGSVTNSTEYRVSVVVAYEARGGKAFRPEETVLDFGDHIRKMRQSRKRS